MEINQLAIQLQIAQTVAHFAIISVPEVRKMAYKIASPMSSMELFDLVKTPEFGDAYRYGVQNNTELISSREELIQQLQKIPELIIFDGRMREFVGGWSSLELSYLADSLIIRSIEVGHARALTELQQYVSAEDCNYQQMIFIGGIEVERPQNLAKGISIIPFPLEKRENWARLPYDRLNSGSNQTLTQIKAALIREGSYPKRHELRENIDFNTPFTEVIADFSDLDDAMLCISLIGPSGPTKIANYTGFVDEVPMSESRKGRDSYYENIRSPSPRLNSDALEKLAKIHSHFCSLQSPDRKSLRVPLTRFNLAMKGNWDVYSAINLGIVLESLFTDEKPFDSSISFLMRVRMARLLRDTFESRRELAELVKSIYTLRSKAAHTGELPQNISGQLSADILMRGAQETASAIEHFIINGHPDWDKIVFS